jgi:DNA-binding YbaB/EbfC family protein
MTMLSLLYGIMVGAIVCLVMEYLFFKGAHDRRLKRERRERQESDVLWGRVQERLKKQMADLRVEATAGGGMVTVEANGKQEITAIKIDPEVVSKDDVQMLEDLVLAACNEALRKSRELVQQELGKLTGGLKIPGLGM